MGPHKLTGQSDYGMCNLTSYHHHHHHLQHQHHHHHHHHPLIASKVHRILCCHQVVFISLQSPLKMSPKLIIISAVILLGSSTHHSCITGIGNLSGLFHWSCLLWPFCYGLTTILLLFFHKISSYMVTRLCT